MLGIRPYVRYKQILKPKHPLPCLYRVAVKVEPHALPAVCFCPCQKVADATPNVEHTARHGFQKRYDFFMIPVRFADRVLIPVCITHVVLVPVRTWVFKRPPKLNATGTAVPQTVGDSIVSMSKRKLGYSCDRTERTGLRFHRTAR